MTTTTVLIAEDEPLAAEALADWVKATPGLQLVAVCEDGEDALAQIRALKPALVLTDIQMPGLTGLQVVQALQRDGEKWVDFMMRFELGLERPDPKRAYSSAATIGGAYIAGGMIPLAPYFAFAQASSALPVLMADPGVATRVAPARRVSPSHREFRRSRSRT